MVPSTCSEKTWQYSLHLSGCTSHVTNFLVCKHHLTLHRQYLNEWAKQHYQKHYQFCHKMLLQLVIPTTRLGSFAAGHQRTQRLVSMYMMMCVCVLFSEWSLSGLVSTACALDMKLICTIHSAKWAKSPLLWCSIKAEGYVIQGWMAHWTCMTATKLWKNPWVVLYLQHVY